MTNPDQQERWTDTDTMVLESILRRAGHNGGLLSSRFRKLLEAEQEVKRLRKAIGKLERNLDGIIDAELPTLEDVEQAILNVLRDHRRAALEDK